MGFREMEGSIGGEVMRWGGSVDGMGPGGV